MNRSHVDIWRRVVNHKVRPDIQETEYQNVFYQLIMKNVYCCLISLFLAFFLTVGIAEAQQGDIVVPNVEAITLEIATQLLQRIGLQVRIQGPSNPSTLVLRQIPRPGLPLNAGDEVLLITGVVTSYPNTTQQHSPITVFQDTKDSPPHVASQRAPVWYPKKFLSPTIATRPEDNSITRKNKGPSVQVPKLTWFSQKAGSARLDKAGLSEGEEVKLWAREEARLSNIEEIKFGVYYPMTGPSAAYGDMGWKGLELAHQQRPEVFGKKVKLVLEDYKSSVGDASKAVSRLIKEEKVVALIGGLTPGSTLAGANIAEENKIPMISPRVTTSNLTLKHELSNWIIRGYTFRTCFTDDLQGRAAAKFARERLDVKLAVIMQQEFGQPYAEEIADSFAQTLDHTSVIKMFFHAGQKDFTTQLVAIAGANPGLIYIAGYPDEIVRIMAQAQELGINIPFMAGDVAETPDLIKNGGKAVEGLYLTTHFGVRPPESFMITREFRGELWDSGEIPHDILDKLYRIKNQEFIENDKFLDTLKTTIGDEQTETYKSLLLESARVPTRKVHTRFVQLFQQSYNQEPDSVSALSWDAYNILLDALEKYGSIAPGNIMDALRKTTNFESATGWLSFSPDSAGPPVIISKVEDGKFVYISRILLAPEPAASLPSQCLPGELCQ